MAGVSDDDLVRLHGWPLGINNVAGETAMPRSDEGTPLALRDAVNIDLDKAGKPRRRQGSSIVHAASLGHSLWSDDHLSFGLYVDDGELCALHEDERREALSLQVGDHPLSYTLINDRILWSSATHCGLLTADLQPHPWAPEHPGAPLAMITPGSLPAGIYQLTATFTDKLGRESGCNAATVIEVPDLHSIEVMLPQPVSPETVAVNLYLTDANDQGLRLHSTHAPGTAQVIVHQQATGRALSTQFMEPMPPGHIVGHHNGRLYVATGRELRWSEPLRYGMWSPRSRVMLPQRADLIATVGDGTEGAGVFVAAGDRTYWLAGRTPDDYTLQIAYSSGAVPGTAVQVSGTVFGLETTTKVNAWLARNGLFCLGLPGGQIVPLKQGEAVVDAADAGAVLIRQEGGLQQLIVALRSPQRQGLAVTDTAVAHVIYAQP